MVTTELRVDGGDVPFTLIVEPWAEEFTIDPGDQCLVVAIHPERIASFSVELRKGGLIAWVNNSGATYQFWRNEQLEFETPVGIP